MYEKPEYDRQHGQWVGSFATVDNEGTVHRLTEWFNTFNEAKAFARHGAGVQCTN